MRVLADLHHFDLFYSFQMMAQRLGWFLYRPIGLDWKTEGYWNLDPDPEFAECMLSEEDGKCEEILSKYDSLNGKTWAVFSLHLPRIGQIDIDKFNEGFCFVEDKSKDIYQQCISLERFKETPFDIIISSVPQHFELFEELRQRYQPQAKHIFHMGPGGINWPVPSGAKNLLLHSPPLSIPPGINHVYYHQEFDLETFDRRLPVLIDTNKVRSYVHFPVTEKLWNDINLDWDFKFVGKTLGRLCDIHVRTKDLAREIASSGWTLHLKPGGESYGHIIHNTAAIGRPLIVNMKDFEDKMAGQLLEDKVTCIDVSSRTPQELKKTLIEFSDPVKHSELCINISERFREVVDFDEEEKKLQRFIEQLK